MATQNVQYRGHQGVSEAKPSTGFEIPRQTLVAKAVSTALIAGLASGPLLAQQAVLEEIIVTATKREESVMDVPIAIQALSGDFIREVNLNDVKDLVMFTPGVTGNSKDSFIDSVRVRESLPTISVTAAIRRSACTRTDCIKVVRVRAFSACSTLNARKFCAVRKGFYLVEIQFLVR